MEKMNFESKDIKAENIKKIEEIFPSCITEIKDQDGNLSKAIDFEALKQILSGDLAEGIERYEFTWPGKNESILEANRPIKKTLRPCKEESKNWDRTENLYIEGDNLDALKLLQESYLGKVKMIYIDPPYNTGSDFIYDDDFKEDRDDYVEDTDQVDDEGNRFFKNTETNGRFHSDWCSMIYPRLTLARNLLSEDGVIFISIDDNEQANLNLICDEVFGEKNKMGQITIETANGVFGTRASALNTKLVKVKDYVLCYSKSNKEKNFKPLYMPTNERFDTHYSIMLDEALTRKSFLNFLKENNYINKFFKKYDMSISLKDISKIMEIDDEFNKIIINDLADKIYQDVSFSLNVPDDINEKLSKGKIVKWKDYLIFKTNNGKGNIRQLIPFKDSLRMTDDYLPEYRKSVAIGDFWEGFDNDMKNVSKEGINLFDSPKPVRLIRQLIKWSNIKNNDMVLDFFSGSATTAHAVMELNSEDGGNRKFIMVQLPEETDEKSAAYKAGYKNICEIGKERIRRAGEKILEDNKDKDGIQNLDIGFRVLKVDSTNMKDVYYKPDEYNQGFLDEMVSNIKEDRTDLDLLFACLLEWGLPLTKSYGLEEIHGKKIHNYDRGALVACFEDNINEEIVKEIAKKEAEMVVFRDSSFKTSADKINVEEIFKELSPDTSIKIM